MRNEQERAQERLTCCLSCATLSLHFLVRLGLQYRVERQRLSVAPHFDGDILADLVMVQQIHKGVAVAKRFGADLGDNVAGLHSGWYGCPDARSASAANRFNWQTATAPSAAARRSACPDTASASIWCPTNFAPKRW